MRPRVITTEHQWVIAATIDVNDQIARKGVQRGVVRIPSDTQIDVMETYCAMCRKMYEDVADAPCSAASIGTEHLRGGPIGVRAKRTGAAAGSIVEPVIRPTPRPALRPVQQPAAAIRATPPPATQPIRPMKKKRACPKPKPWSAGDSAALMLPFPVDATLTG